MSGLFLSLVNRSLAACWLILAILLLRPFLRKVSPTICCALWGLVAIRLLCPFSIESVLSLIPSAEPIPADLTAEPLAPSAPLPTFPDGGNFAVSQPAGMDVSSATHTVSEAPASVLPQLTKIAAVVWIIGIAALASYLLISYLRLHLRAREAVQQEGGYWLCDRIASPFVLGALRPRILLPYTVERGDIPYILAHERAHLARRDHWRKPVGFALLALFWFQPMMWLSYFLLCRDIEFACDERALRTLGTDVKSRKSYAEALLHGVSPRASIIACPFAFGGLQIKRRVQSVLKYKKPAMLLTLAAVIVCAAVAVCFLSNPVTRASEGPKGDSSAAGSSSHLSDDATDLTMGDFYPFYGTILERAPDDYGWDTIRSDDSALLAQMFGKAQNADLLSAEEPVHLPTFRFDSEEEWRAFRKAYGELLGVTEEMHIFPGKYENFFETHVLIVIYAPRGMAKRGRADAYACDGKWVQVLGGTGKQKENEGGNLYLHFLPRSELSLYPEGFDAVVYPAGKPVFFPDDLPYDPVSRLEELEELYPGFAVNGFPYLAGVLSGIIDPTAPKLDLETMQEIIASCAQENEALQKIMDELYSRQLYPDMVWGSGLSYVEYWLDEYGKDKIVFCCPGRSPIWHETILPDGTEFRETLFDPYSSVGWSETRETLVLSLLGKMSSEGDVSQILDVRGEVGAYTLCRILHGDADAIVDNVYAGYRIFAGSVGYPSETHLYLVSDTKIYTLNAAYELGLIDDMGALYALLPESMQAGYDPSAEDSYGGWDGSTEPYGFVNGVYRAE